MTDPIEHRLQTVRGEFRDWNVDAILITSPTNRRWLSGFTGSAGRLLIAEEHTILAADSRYWEQAAIEAPQFDLFQDKRTHEDTIELIKSVNVRRIGLEANHITLSNANKLRSIEDITWVPLQKPVDRLRQIKSRDEITTIRAAAAITDEVMAAVPKLVRLDMTERDLAWTLEKTMRENGADAMAFPIIVAFGPNSALPHHQPGSRRLRDGEIVLVDMGADLEGYKSDLTRTFFFGNQLEDQFSAVYDLVLAAHENAAAKIKPGINTQDAHAFALDRIAAGGYGKNFQHGLGHGVGLDIHEDPHISQLRPARNIAEKMIVTIEPGVYLPGWGGIRIEDLYLVGKTGLEAISRCPKIAQIRPQT
jgi:Xaa-Pro aminopeptidase